MLILLGLFVAVLIVALVAAQRRSVAVTLGLSVTVNGTTISGVTDMSIRANQKISLNINPLDAFDKPAPVTNINWRVAQDTGVLVPAADGMSAQFIPSVAGDVTIIVAAVNAAGATLTDSVVVTTEPSVAITLNLTLGPVTDQ